MTSSTQVCGCFKQGFFHFPLSENKYFMLWLNSLNAHYLKSIHLHLAFVCLILQSFQEMAWCLKCFSLLFEATSSRTVQETNEEFKTMTGTIQLGRKLITKYNRRELTDKLLIFLALALFLATVLYILKKRLFPFL